MIAAFFGRIFGGISTKLLAGVAIAMAFLGALLYARKSGKDAARVEGLEHKIENVEVRNEVEREVGRAAPDAVHQRLRDKWSRD